MTPPGHTAETELGIAEEKVREQGMAFGAERHHFPLGICPGICILSSRLSICKVANCGKHSGWLGKVFLQHPPWEN